MRTRRPAILLAALLGVLSFAAAPPADAHAAKHKKVKPPAATRVAPMRAIVGQTLTIKGHDFRPGKGKTSVGFKAPGARIVFVKARLSTRRMLKVTLPASLEQKMAGKRKRVRLRILAKRFSRHYTARKRSPLVSPRSVDCESDAARSSAGDDDHDFLPDTLEACIGTDPRKPDSDGDGVTDGYEYRSAIDLNDDEYERPNSSLPWPGKRPYPNPLDGSDAGVDFDGDGISLGDEQRLWLATSPPANFSRFEQPAAPAVSPLSYSDGLQYSASEYCPSPTHPAACGAGDENRRVPSLGTRVEWQRFATSPAVAAYASVHLHSPGWTSMPAGWADFNLVDFDRDGSPSAGTPLPAVANPNDRDGDGWLSDDERDVDADGLSNADELDGRMTTEYWTACYGAEAPYPGRYANTDPTLTDTDGDGVPDGVDDEDHDDVPNIMELSRSRASHLNDAEGGQPCSPPKDPNADGPSHPDAFGQVNPFNPCEPDRKSRTCVRYVKFGAAFAPFTAPDWWALQ